MEDNDIDKKLRTQFNVTRIGYISKYVEPISVYSSLEDARILFASNEDYTSIPVERDTGVTGLLARDNIIKRSKSMWEVLRETSLDNYREPDTMIFNAQENTEKVLARILSAQSKETLFKDFLIYNYGKYLGVGTFLTLTRHISSLRDRDQAKARSMQEYLMTRIDISNEIFNVSKFVSMVYELGGDFYQTIKLTDGLYLAAGFDVSGKGIAAALSTSIISAFFTTMEMAKVIEQHNFEEIVDLLNNTIKEQIPEGMFITASLLFIDTKKMEITSFNCGYSPVYVFFKENGKYIAKIYSPNLQPLGIGELKDLDKMKRTFPILDNMKIYLYSDGLTDARNEEGEMYGDENLKKYLLTKINMPADTLISDLKRELTEFIGRAPQADDITVLGLQFR